MAKTQVEIGLPIEFSEVCEVVHQDLNGTNGRSLSGVFSQAIAQGGTFNTTYSGSKDRLSNFRGYTIAYAPSVPRLWNSIDISSTGQYQTGVVYGGLIYYSSNYGVNWIEISTMADNNFISVSMSDSGQYQTALSNVIFISTNFGATWTQNFSTESHICVEVTNTGQNQIRASQSNYLQLSTDYGSNWSAIVASGVESWSGAIMTDDKQIMIGSTGGSIYRSTDYGANFSEIATGYNYYSLRSSSTMLYVLALVNGGYMRRSTDYGANWTDLTSAGSRIWRSADISSTGQYQTAADNHYIYRSADYGVNWTQITAAGDRDWRGLAVSGTGQYQTAAAYSGYSYRSTDYGVNWTQI